LYTRIFKNATFLAIAEAINRASSFVVGIWLARYLGADDFGRWTFVLSTLALFYIIADLGLSTLATRDIAQQREKSSHYLGNLLVIKLVLSLVAFLLVILTIPWLRDDARILTITYPLGLATLINALTQTLYVTFRAHEKMYWEAISKSISGITTIAVVGALIVARLGISPLGWGYALASLLVLGVTTVITWRFITTFTLRFDRDFVKYLAIETWPFALGTAFASVYRYIDSIMLGRLRELAEVGQYNAAYRIVDAMILGSTLAGVAIYPLLSRLAHHHQIDKLRHISARLTSLFATVTVPVVVLVILWSTTIMRWIYGNQYTAGTASLAILAGTALISYLNVVPVKLLQSTRHQRIPMYAAGLGTVVNITLNILLIPAYGMWGAAWVTLISEALIALLTFRAVAKAGAARPRAASTASTATPSPSPAQTDAAGACSSPTARRRIRPRSTAT